MAHLCGGSQARKNPVSGYALRRGAVVGGYTDNDSVGAQTADGSGVAWMCG